MLSMILIAVLFAYTAICTLWAVFMRKFRKTRVRFFLTLGSFIVALIATFISKSFIEGESFATNTLIPLLASGDASLAEFFASSDALRQTLIGAGTSLLAPLLFLVFFLVANFLSWIIYLLIILIVGGRMKAKDADRTVGNTLGSVGFSVGKVFLVVFVWMVPVIAYTGLVPAALEGFTDTDILPAEERAMYEEVVDGYIEPIRNDPTVSTFRMLGAGLVSDTLTSFTVGDTHVSLETEVGAISHFGGCAIELTQTDFKQYDEAQMAVFDKLSAAFEESATLPSILAEVVHDATGAWKSGEPYFGIYYDTIRFDSEGMFDPFLDKAIEILYADTEPGNTGALSADIHTVFDVLEVLIKHGVFANAEMHEDLLYNLARDGTITELIAVLEQNDSMKQLVPEITAIGVNAIGSALGGAGGEQFTQVMDTVATELNAVKQMGTPEEQKNYISEVFRGELAREELMVDDAIIEKYADLMVDDLLASKGEEDLTSDDLVVFFAENAWQLEEDIPDAEIPDELPDELPDDIFGELEGLN